MQLEAACVRAQACIYAYLQLFAGYALTSVCTCSVHKYAPEFPEYLSARLHAGISFTERFVSRRGL